MPAPKVAGETASRLADRTARSLDVTAAVADRAGPPDRSTGRPRRPVAGLDDVGCAAVLQRDEWLVGRGYLSAESVSLVLTDEMSAELLHHITGRDSRRLGRAMRPVLASASGTDSSQMRCV
jgi:hypothetical protein